MFVEEVARAFRFSPWRLKYQGELCEGEIEGVRVLLLKPLTYMNESGRSVGEVLKFYKIPLDKCLVAHDELDLAYGKSRLKMGGGHAGHNGLRSIMAHCGDGFKRLRLGIGHPGHKDLVHNYVLGDFSMLEKPALLPFLDSHIKHLPLYIKGDDAGFMSKANMR
jgi:peptidyl-tRNA hydrolase, PTH1 family